LILRFDVDERCPEAGLCSFDLPVTLQSNRDDVFSLVVEASVGVTLWDSSPSEEGLDDGFYLDDLHVQVFIVDADESND